MKAEFMPEGYLEEARQIVMLHMHPYAESSQLAQFAVKECADRLSKDALITALNKEIRHLEKIAEMLQSRAESAEAGRFDLVAALTKIRDEAQKDPAAATAKEARMGSSVGYGAGAR